MENSIILEEILEELTENAKHISSSSLENSNGLFLFITFAR